MNIRLISQYISLFNGQDVYQKLHRYLDNTYNQLLADESNPHRLHNFLANLTRKIRQKEGYRNIPYQLLVTTNYDEILEQVFANVGQEYDLVFYVAEGEGHGRFKHKTYEGEENLIDSESYRLPLGQRPIILKLYGTWKDKFVVTEDHYINYMAGHTIEQLLPSKLITFIRKSNILFMGYSLNDPDLQIILNKIWANKSVKSRESYSWIVHQSQPGLLENTSWFVKKVDAIKSSLEDFITNLEMEIEQL